MKLIVESETRIRLESAGADFEIDSEIVPLSPYQFLAGSLASCTVLTLASWAEGARIDTASLITTVSWEVLATRPQRIARMEMELRWPGLPPARVPAAVRVADLCPIHATLRRAAEITRRIVPT